MSRDLVQQKQLQSSIDQMAKHVDVDAEHDPKASRLASNAALRREAVQMRGTDAATGSSASVHAAAEAGVQSQGTALPHADKIQAAFGRHDISGIQAHVGGDAAAASQAMGAEAYATGNHVAFAGQPDLHTAAHEAAHVVQQRGGVQLKAGVGAANDTYEQQADAVADRVVQGKSAEDLLGAPGSASAQSDTVQMKEAPTQAQADSALIHAVQTQVKLAAARMNAAAAQILDILRMPAGGPAGHGVIMQLVDAQVSGVNSELHNVWLSVTRVPNVLKGTLGPELGHLHGAFHMTWAPALGRLYSYTHDAAGNLYDFAQGMNIGITQSQRTLSDIYQGAGMDPANIQATLPTRIGDPAGATQQRDEELKAAELEALKSSMYSVEVAVDLINADLHSSMQNLDKEAIDLTASVQVLVDTIEPISPDHIGKIAKLPVVIQKVETLQGEVMKMKDANESKGQSLAPKIGYNTPLSSNLHRLKTKIAAIKSYQKATKNRH